MHRGYVKIFRKLSDNEFWFSETFTRGQAWIDLVMLAQHKPGAIRKRGILIKLPVGAVGYSQSALSERWKWSRGKVIRFLDELEAVQQIVQQKSKVTTLIHIVNYLEYQQDEQTIVQQTDNKRTTNGQQTDNKRTTNGQQTVQEQEVKSLKKLKNKEYSVRFEEFWTEYPKKIAKKKCYSLWISNKCENGLFEKVMISLSQQKEKWDDMKFIPHPATWLNQQRWENVENITKGKVDERGFEI